MGELKQHTIKQTQNDKATLKQHVCRSSFLYLLLIPLSFLVLKLRKLRCFVRSSSLILPSLREVTIREGTISMQLESVDCVSKHRFREFTKQTWTSLLFDRRTFILCDANWEFLLVDSACAIKIVSLGRGRYKMVALVNTSSERIIGNP